MNILFYLKIDKHCVARELLSDKYQNKFHHYSEV